MRFRSGIGFGVAFAAGCALLGFAIGCGSGSAPDSAARTGNSVTVDGEPEPPEDPEYVQLRAALFQIRSAIDLVQEAYTAAKAALDRRDLTAEKRNALEDAVAYLDSAGANLAEQGGSPPAEEALRTDPALVARLKSAAREAVADALMDLREAAGILDSVSEGRPDLAELPRLADLAVEAVSSALRELGGKDPAAEPEPPI